MISRSHLLKGIQFLKKKGVYKNDPLGEIQYHYLRNPYSLPKHQQQKYLLACKQLIRLTSQTKETHLLETPKNVQQFDPNKFPKYDPENIFFLKYPNTLVQRQQLRGLCYMHAPAVVQYYAIAKTTGECNHKMIDVHKVIRDHFDAKQLEAFIFGNAGGTSLEFLQDILIKGSVIVSDTRDIPGAFRQFGVGLVSMFHVYQDFKNTTVHHHYGQPSGSFVGKNAMALVGHRQENNTRYYLLQNWWKEKQFVEIDEEYLEKSSAIVHFVKTPQTHVPSSFATVSGRYFETSELLEKAEGVSVEM